MKQDLKPYMEKIVHYLLLSLKSTEGVTVSERIVLPAAVPVVLAVSVFPGFARSLKVFESLGKMGVSSLVVLFNFDGTSCCVCWVAKRDTVHI